jgi:hypothetical protein
MCMSFRFEVAELEEDYTRPEVSVLTPSEVIKVWQIFETAAKDFIEHE